MAIPAHLKSTLLTAFVLCAATAVIANGQDGSCPAADRASGPVVNESLITSYISVDGDGMVLCGMQYSVPMTATLYQGMLCASEQHGSDFQFTSEVFAMWGHFIDSINGVAPMGGFYWFLFDKANLMTTPVGVDWITLVNDTTYIWYYANSTNHNQTYSGPCESSSTIPPPNPLTYKVAYLSVTTSNASQVHVCKKVILIPPSPAITAYELLESANDQIPIDVQAVLNMSDNTVTSFNGVANDDTYTWRGYPAASNEPIPLDLSMTTVSDGDLIEFRFVENDLETGPGNGAPPIGQTVPLLLLALAAALMVSM